MREIEFRAWVESGDYKEMLPNVQKHIGAATGFGHILQNTAKGFDVVAVMQYTGLKDKNGVKIFEGDIVKFKFLEGSQKSVGLIGVFNYNDIDLRYEIDIYGDPEYVCLSYIGDGRFYGFEVIGDTFKNPELLEAS